MRKKILASLLLTAAACGLFAAAVYYAITRGPAPIKVDPKTYDDYAGSYDYRNGYILSIRREGDRLMASVPDRLPMELFPETDTRFFIVTGTIGTLPAYPARYLSARGDDSFDE
jgi:hypothetical protein